MSLRASAKAKQADMIPNGNNAASVFQGLELPAPEDRIFVDNSNVTELKLTCDEAVERILTKASPSVSVAPAPGSSNNGASSPLSPTSPASSTASLPRVPTDGSQPFPPFKASHFHTDLRLALGFASSAIMIGTSLWAYFVEKEWEKNKWPCAVAVVLYLLLTGIQTLNGYFQGNNIFVGKRKMLSKRIETERLVIASPPLPKPITAAEPSVDGKRWTTPPVYTLEIDYTRKSNGGKSLLREAKQKVVLGHMGEWFTEEGEFVEAIFQQKLLVGLEKAFGH